MTNSTGGAMSVSAWQEGADAARDGLGTDACPYPHYSSDHQIRLWRLGWMNGWDFARTQYYKERGSRNSSVAGRL